MEHVRASLAAADMGNFAAVSRFITPPPAEMEHVLKVWRMVGGKLVWAEVLIAAEFEEGDAEYLIEGLQAVRDEVVRHREERMKAKP
jgi:hypothetical protein